MKKLTIISIFLSVLLSQEFQIARIQYGGGGETGTLTQAVCQIC